MWTENEATALGSPQAHPSILMPINRPQPTLSSPTVGERSPVLQPDPEVCAPFRNFRFKNLESRLPANLLLQPLIIRRLISMCRKCGHLTHRAS